MNNGNGKESLSKILGLIVTVIGIVGAIGSVFVAWGIFSSTVQNTSLSLEHQIRRINKIENDIIALQTQNQAISKEIEYIQKREEELYKKYEDLIKMVLLKK